MKISLLIIEIRFNQTLRRNTSPNPMAQIVTYFRDVVCACVLRRNFMEIKDFGWRLRCCCVKPR